MHRVHFLVTVFAVHPTTALMIGSSHASPAGFIAE
jgi:hypothetical protein